MVEEADPTQWERGENVLSTSADAITVYGHKTNGSVHLISVKTGILVSQIDIETIL